MKSIPIRSNGQSSNGDRGDVVLLVGPNAKGPARCLKCGQPFKPGEVWRRYTSPDEPEHGSYSYGIHEKCMND